MPFSVESFGRLGKPAMAFLRRMVRDAGLRGAARGRFLASAHRELSVALARGNSGILRAGAKVYVRVAGKDRKPGRATPAVEPCPDEAMDFGVFDD